MSLESSGAISIGGSVTDRSINVELGRSATAQTSLNESDLRDLAGVASGAISLSAFHGKSAVVIIDQQTITVGNRPLSARKHGIWGYVVNLIGSINDGTCNFKSGASYPRIQWLENRFGVTSQDAITIEVAGIQTNSGWTTVNIAGTIYSRTNATFQTNSSKNWTRWRYLNVPNPLGTTVNAIKTVTFT